MATVVVTYPLDGGTYGTQADGSLVPFVATGYVDVPGQVVTVYENGSSALLGSVSADTDPEDQGAYVGWYYWAIPVVAWTAGGAGVLVPFALGTGTAANVSLAATVPVPAGTGVADAGALSTSATTILGVPAASGIAAGGGVSLAGALGVGAGTGTATGADISVTYDSTAPSVGTLTVPDTSGTSITGISASATDAVGVIGWKILEQAADSGWSSPNAGDAGWTSVTPTTNFSASDLTFTSAATETGTRYFRIYFKDAASNVAGSATDSAVITISGATVLTFESGDEGMTLSTFARSGTSPITGSFSLRAAATGFTSSQTGYARKTVTVTNGATISIKYRGSLVQDGDMNATLSVVINFNGTEVAAADQASGFMDGTVRTLSGTWTGATDTKLLEVAISAEPETWDSAPDPTDYTITVDDITFS